MIKHRLYRFKLNSGANLYREMNIKMNEHKIITHTNN